MSERVRKYCFGGLLILVTAANGIGANVVAVGGGDWSELQWMTTAKLRVDAPGIGDSVILGGDSSVEFGLQNQLAEVGEVIVGFDNNGSYSFYDSANASLTISSGVLRVEGDNGIRVAFGVGATATLNISGGELETTVGRLDIALGDQSSAEVHLSEGRLVTAGTTIVSAVNTPGQRAKGVLRVSGGEWKSSIILIGRRGQGTNEALFEQTGGSVFLQGNSFLAVGQSASADSEPLGTARITGGEFAGGVRVGREIGTDGVGFGKFIVGPEANISGGNGANAWEVGHTGEIIFELGTDRKFNPIDLRSLKATPSIVFDAGARIVVDGSKLVGSTGNASITLMKFGSRSGPTAESQSAVQFEFVGFASGFSPELVWTSSELKLKF